MKRTASLLGIITIFIFGAIIIGTSVAYGWTKDKGPEGLILWGVDLSGLDRETALKELKKQIPKSLVYQNKIFPLTYDRSLVNLELWLDQQYSRNTNNGILNALNYIGKNRKLYRLAIPKFERDEIIPQLEKIAEEINVLPQPAQIQLENGKLVYKPGLPGTVLDLEETWKALNSSPDGSDVSAVITSVETKPAFEDLILITDKIGDFTTYYDPNNRERTNNLRLAASAIDGYLLPPGGEFSFNKVVGERSREKGYLPAQIYVDQGIELSVGGGICQTATTLYQAARQAKLPIIERHTHSQPLAYAPADEDATVAYGQLDLRFINNTSTYIFIKCEAKDHWIRVQIYGQGSEQEPQSFPYDKSQLKK